MIVRFPYWESKLNAFIEERRNAPFQWGVNDCCLFACDAVKSICGYDFAESLRGTYSTAYGAGKVYLKLKVKDVSELGWKYVDEGKLSIVDIRKANRGDFLVYANCKNRSLGISIGECGAFVSEKGLAFIPRIECVTAFTY